MYFFKVAIILNSLVIIKNDFNFLSVWMKYSKYVIYIEFHYLGNQYF